MPRRHKSLMAAIATTGTVLGLLAGGTATSALAAPAWRTHVCHGTIRHPGVLVGLNLNVVVRGLCLVNHGPVSVSHDVLILPGSALIAAFGQHGSRLIVSGNILVRHGGTLILGCEPKHFPCVDDPHPKRPTLSSHGWVGGSIIASHALGVVVHNTWIGHSVIQFSGGGGLSCNPRGPFAQFHSPAYSDYEDNWIGGSLFVRGVRSCWLGILRNWIGVNGVVSRNIMASPDAMEVLGNVVHRDLICWRNHPKVQYGDSHGTPNRVGLHAFFECGFRRIVPNPAGQHRHFSHISVPLR